MRYSNEWHLLHTANNLNVCLPPVVFELATNVVLMKFYVIHKWTNHKKGEQKRKTSGWYIDALLLYVVSDTKDTSITGKPPSARNFVLNLKPIQYYPPPLLILYLLFSECVSEWLLCNTKSALFQLHCISLQRVSDWLLFNAKWAMFQLYHCENKLHFEQMMTLPTLYSRLTCSAGFQ